MLIGSGICGFNFNCPSHPFFSCHLWGKICRKKLRESTLKIARQFCLLFSNPTRSIVSLTGWASYKLQNQQVWLLESLFVQPPGPHTDFVDWSRSAVLSGVPEYLCSRCISANNMYSTLHHTPPVYPPNAWQTRCNNPPFDVYGFQSPLSLASYWYIVFT